MRIVKGKIGQSQPNLPGPGLQNARNVKWEGQRLSFRLPIFQAPQCPLFRGIVNPRKFSWQALTLPMFGDYIGTRYYRIPIGYDKKA